MTAQERRIYAGGDLRSQVASRLAASARSRRNRDLLPLTGLRPHHRVVDLGCGTLGPEALAGRADLTGVDLEDRPSYPGRVIVADLTRRLPFADGEFDLAYSSSVVEHLPQAVRESFAAEVRRIARGHYVQTPAREFPIEPHSLLPAVHWLPRRAQERLWRFGVAGGMEDIALLRRRELEDLFGGWVVAERFGPLAKSWIAIRPIT